MRYSLFGIAVRNCGKQHKRPWPGRSSLAATKIVGDEASVLAPSINAKWQLTYHLVPAGQEDASALDFAFKESVSPGVPLKVRDD